MLLLHELEHLPPSPAPRQVLLLHELEHLLELAPQPLHARAALLVAPQLAACIASDNSRVAERALSLFSSDGAP